MSNNVAPLISPVKNASHSPLLIQVIPLSTFTSKSLRPSTWNITIMVRDVIRSNSQVIRLSSLASSCSYFQSILTQLPCPFPYLFLSQFLSYSLFHWCSQPTGHREGSFIYFGCYGVSQSHLSFRNNVALIGYRLPELYTMRITEVQKPVLGK